MTERKAERPTCHSRKEHNTMGPHYHDEPDVKDGATGGRKPIGYCRDCRVPVYSQTVSVDHQANGCRIQYDERPGVPAPLPVAECGYHFQSKHGVPSVCEKPKGHAGDCIGRRAANGHDVRPVRA